MHGNELPRNRETYSRDREAGSGTQLCRGYTGVTIRKDLTGESELTLLEQRSGFIQHRGGAKKGEYGFVEPVIDIIPSLA